MARSETVAIDDRLPVMFGISASADEIALARLVDNLVGDKDFDFYMRASGILTFNP
jgi:hypothetical protein